MSEMRPFDDLRASGVLWAINRVLFHPRGYAMELHLNPRGEVEGWSLVGDGTEVWQYVTPVDEDAFFAAFEETLRSVTES